MAKQHLGTIGRPRATTFKNKGPTILLAFLVPSPDVSYPDEYAPKVRKYWHQVGRRIDELTGGLGPLRRIFHEGVNQGGEAGLSLVREVNPAGAPVIERLTAAGAHLEATEAQDLLDEQADWNACSQLTLRSPRVRLIVSQLVQETTLRRDQHVSQRIKDAVGKDDISVVFVREDHGLVFPEKAQILRVVPPVLNDLHRLLAEAGPAG